MRDHEEHAHVEKSKQVQVSVLACVVPGGQNGLVFANNLVWLYFFWEVTTLCSFMLISHDKTQVALNNAARALWIEFHRWYGIYPGHHHLYATQGGASALFGSEPGLEEACIVAP